MGPSATGTAMGTFTPTMMSDGQHSCHQPEEEPVAVSSISFDEMSSMREDFLLVLVSSMSGSLVQAKNQKRAVTILAGCGIHPEVLDAADPSNATVRDELCEMSGIRGHYPQFFLVQGDQTTFFADFADLEHMNEEGTLMEWLGVAITSQPLPNENNEDHCDDDTYEQVHALAKQELTTAMSSAEDTTAATSMVESLQYDVPHEEELDEEWQTEQQHRQQMLEGRASGDGVDHGHLRSPQYGTYHPPDDVYCADVEENDEAASPFSQDPQWGGDYFEDHQAGEDEEVHHEYQYPGQQQQVETVTRQPDSKGSEWYEEATYKEPSPPPVHRTNRRVTSCFDQQRHHEQAVARQTQTPQGRVAIEAAAAGPPPRSASTTTSSPRQRNDHVLDSEPYQVTPSPPNPKGPNRRIPAPGSWEANFGSSHSMRQGWEPDLDPSPTQSESPNSMSDDLLLHDALPTNGTPNVREQYDVPTLQTLQSILSCDDDDTVDTTATSSSIVTSTRVTSLDLGLRIRPEEEVHFWLSEETPRCIITLSNMSTSYLPLAFKIQASHRRRYMVWPSVGLVKPQCTMSVSVFFVEDAKRDLLDLFRKLGPAAEFRQQDSLMVEWCGVPTDFCNQLTDDHDTDLETLSSYWNTCRKNEGWASEQSILRVRVSVNDKDQSSAHRGRIQRLGHDAPTMSGDNGATSSPLRNVQHDGHRGIVAYGSMLSETEQLLQAELENLRGRCEELTAERLIMEQQLEEARERISPPRSGAIHKFQLQQTMRCGACLQVFKSDPSSLRAPIASRACGHSICRNCCYRRARAQRHSLSSDLLMCVGDMGDANHGHDSCPICDAPNAFGNDRLHVNQSLSLVLKLLDG